MSGIGKWNIGIGAVLLGVAMLCSVLNLIPAAVITGILGLLGISIAGYDVVDNWLDRAELRRRGASARQESESRQGR